MNKFYAVTSHDPFAIAPPLSEKLKAKRSYRPVEGLEEACNVAMLLGTPLLLTGEPGTGKTRAAHWLADKLKIRLLIANVKSASTAKDLLYSFDEIARFRDSQQAGTKKPLVQYLQFQPLGAAILRAAGGKTVLFDQNNDEELDRATILRRPDILEAVLGETGLCHPELGLTVDDLLPKAVRPDYSDPHHVVVLIDELDKAARDTPNDLLTEIDDMAFRIDELGLTIRSSKAKRPIVIMTNNSEKSLPEPFLRRCCFFHIPFPKGPGELAKIVTANLGGEDGAAEDSLNDQQVSVLARIFYELRDEAGLQKKPATSEFLAWAGVVGSDPLLKGFTTEDDLGSDHECRKRFVSTLSVLAKSKGDRDRSLEQLRRLAPKESDD